jgi:uridine kinase
MLVHRVGIAGGTASGKTALTLRIHDYGGDDRVTTIERERYFGPAPWLTPRRTHPPIPEPPIE